MLSVHFCWQTYIPGSRQMCDVFFRFSHRFYEYAPNLTCTVEIYAFRFAIENACLYLTWALCTGYVATDVLVFLEHFYQVNRIINFICCFIWP
jgi:hypothetical protein